MRKEKNSLIDENKQVAEDNLTFQSTYQQKRQRLIDAVQECHSLKRKLDAKMNGASDLNDNHLMNHTMSMMQAAMVDSEEASEQIASALLNKQISVEQFVEVFEFYTFQE